jgi:hypothetical protein
LKIYFLDHVCAAVFPTLEFNFNLDLRIDILVWALAVPLVLGFSSVFSSLSVWDSVSVHLSFWQLVPASVELSSARSPAEVPVLVSHLLLTEIRGWVIVLMSS